MLCRKQISVTNAKVVFFILYEIIFLTNDDKASIDVLLGC